MRSVLTLRADRYKQDYDPWKHPAARPFVRLVEWLASCLHPPRAVIIEGVLGLIRRDPKRHGQTPLSYIMNHKKFGLHTLDHRYMVLEMPLIFTGGVAGLPLHRSRLFLYMVRKDVCCVGYASRLLEAAHIINDNPIPKSDLRTYEATESFTVLPAVHPAKARKTHLEAHSLEETKRVRKELGLPSRSSLGSRPASSCPAEFGLAQGSLSAREWDVMDVAVLWSVKKYPEGAGRHHPNLMVDVSQSVGRQAWRQDGKCSAVHTHSKLWFDNGLVDPATLFNYFGWPRDSMQVPSTMTGSQLRKIIGNMVSTPVAGLACLSLLVSVDRGMVS